MVTDAVDPDSVPVPMGVEPSKKVTVPVGAPAPGAGTVTVAVKVTDWPKTDGFTEDATLVAVAAGAQSGIGGRVQAGGKPVSGSTVTAYAAGAGAPAKLGEAKTDAQGIATLPAPAGADARRFLVARQGDDVAMLPASEHAYGGSEWSKRVRPVQLQWFVTDDRALYRPGGHEGWRPSRTRSAAASTTSMITTGSVRG